MQRHRHQEFIRFLNAIEAAVPAERVSHVILDSYTAHKHPKVMRWLGRHPRFVFHFTPTSASLLNAAEGFFAKLTEINANPSPFRWTKDPDAIVAAKRRYQALDSIH